MYQSATASRSFNNLSETRQREDSIPRTLTLATSKLESLFEHGAERVSPVVKSAKYSDFFSSTSSLSSPVDGFGSRFAPIPEETGPTSLPPPPRRSARRKRVKTPPPESQVAEPTESLPQKDVVAEEPPQNVESVENGNLKKPPSASSLHTAGTMSGSSSSLLTVNGQIRSEPSFEELTVQRKMFSSDRPRIVSLLSIPSIPTPITEQSENSYASDQRLPVDDRDSPPLTPVQPEAPKVAVEVVVAPASPPAGADLAPFVFPQYTTQPLRIEKLGGTKSSKNVFHPTSGDEPRLAKGPSILRKGSNKDTAVGNRPRIRGKLMKVRDEMRQQPYGILVSSSRDGRPAVPADNPWRHRPLLSHAKSLSLSSCDSDTTYNPPSSIDPGPDNRISISSSIYPESALRSIPDDDDDRASYIQLASPSDNDRDDHDYDYDDDERNDILEEIQSEQVIHQDNYQLMSILSGSRVIPSQPKPPLPTTPKPIFTRRALSPQSSPSQSPVAPSLVFEGYETSVDLPPTTNWLGQDERADLIRKSRKLARVFGRTPGPDVMAHQDSSRTAQIAAGLPRHQRTPLSFSNDLDNTAGLRRRRASAWPSLTESHLSLSANRRHSAPLSPDDISFLNASSPLYEASLSQVASQFRSDPSGATQILAPSNDTPVVTYEMEYHSSPHTSFIDLYLSDEEGQGDGITSDTNKSTNRPSSPSAQSYLENMTIEQLAEEERRRKREKLAKLHRHLGSRVPANLVLGVVQAEPGLPPSAAQLGQRSMKGSSSEAEDSAGRKAWLRRRQSSSAALPSAWPEELERKKEELDTKEKALNVRRAQKMEKVFGVAPPQTLYHTRHSPSLPSVPTPKLLGSPSAFVSSAEVVYFTRNPNQSPYQKTKNNRKTNRPGTAESSKPLLYKGRRSSTFDDNHNNPMSDSIHNRTSGISHNNGEGSAIYNHFQHSMNSLNDIMDRDDRESLLELHHYLNGEGDSPVDAMHRDGITIRERKMSDSSTKTERRLSLPNKPSNASIVSTASEDAGGTSPKPDITDFQLRRRRAAKLTQFFGVHYRELINDVLDSLENGLEHEQKRGTLQADEIADLVKRLRELKVKREGMF